MKPTEAPFNVRWTFSQYQIISLRWDDFMAIDMGKLQHKERALCCPSFEKDMHQEALSRIHHRFVNDPDFRASQLEHDRDEEVCIKMDELLQNDFSHHMTQAEYFRYRSNGVFLFIMTEHLDDCKIVLTSTRRCPHCTIYTKNLENDNDGNNHRVLPPVVGNGAISGGADNNSNETPHMSLRAKRHDRTGRPVVCSL